eukprot:281680-Pleurochrysis_carterae.AAC.2
MIGSPPEPSQLRKTANTSRALSRSRARRGEGRASAGAKRGDDTAWAHAVCFSTAASVARWRGWHKKYAAGDVAFWRES